VVSPGVELGVTQAMDMSRPELAGLTLGGSSTLLLESPYSDAVRFFDRAVFELTANGFRVLLAHPERSPLFRKDPGLLERLVESGTLCSLTAGSLAGRFGRSVRDFSRELLERELIHNVASDAHDLERRPPGLKAASSEIPPPLFSWLSKHVPRAILTDAPLPDRPSRQAPNGRRTRRRRWRMGRRL
jgi:protein-tyrosine phosphatase